MVVKLTCGMHHEKFAFYLDTDILIDLFITHLLKNDEFIEIKSRYSDLKKYYSDDDWVGLILDDNKMILQKYNLEGILNYVNVPNEWMFDVDDCKKILPILISLSECDLMVADYFLEDLVANIDIFSFAINEKKCIIIV